MHIIQLHVRHNGEDMTGSLLEAFERHPEYSKTEKVRIDVLRICDSSIQKGG